MIQRLKARLRIHWIQKYKLKHRNVGYRILGGQGAELGAFYLPAALPRGCKVTYCDAQSREDALEKFPELRPYPLVPVDVLVDVDQSGLSAFQEDQFDFFIMNHVIEHVANPIRVLQEIYRVVKPGGHLVITAPDKDYSIDRPRKLTPFSHLLEEYQQGINFVSDDHYLDFIQAVHPEYSESSEDRRAEILRVVKTRREHAHVWNSQSFKEFFETAHREVIGKAVGKGTRLIYESPGNKNRNEYFSIWKVE